MEDELDKSHNEKVGALVRKKLTDYIGGAYLNMMGETELGLGMGISFASQCGEVEYSEDGNSLSIASVLRVTVTRETNEPPETLAELIAQFESQPMPGDELFEIDEGGQRVLKPLPEIEDVIEAIGPTTVSETTITSDPFTKSLSKFEATPVAELASDSNLIYLLLSWGPEFLARPWETERLDRVGLLLAELAQVTTCADSRKESLYLLVRLVGERRREPLVEPLLRVLKGVASTDIRNVAKHCLTRVDARCRSAVGQLLGPRLSSLTDYFGRAFDPDLCRLQFYEGD